jgi:nucleotide-binding universal stress UspA family protein
MTNAQTESAIVVGIAPEGRICDGTIDFVVDTAACLDVGVLLVHVVPTVVGGPTGAWQVGTAFDELVIQGHLGLDNALARFRDHAGGQVPVDATLVRGGVVHRLVECSRDSQLVVLEHRHLNRWARFNDGSVTGGVAARAHAPVVSVPAGWHAGQRRLPVTVAVEDAKRAQAEVWTALGMAAASDAPLQILRAVYLPTAYREFLRGEVEEEDFLVVAREELERDVGLPQSVRDQVPCHYEVRWGRAAEVLVNASSASALVVVAKRNPVLPFASHLGSVVRHLLREADGPVMVVEPTLAEPVASGEAVGAVAG